MRYTKQRTKYDCGPVAIANVCKWAGVKFSYKKYKNYLFEDLEVDNEIGTKHDKFLSTLNQSSKLGFKVYPAEYKIKLNDINIHVKNNRAVVLIVESKNRTHVCLVTEIKNGYYKIINYALDWPTISYVWEKTLIEEDLVAMIPIERNI